MTLHLGRIMILIRLNARCRLKIACRLPIADRHIFGLRGFIARVVQPAQKVQSAGYVETRAGSQRMGFVGVEVFGVVIQRRNMVIGHFNSFPNRHRTGKTSKDRRAVGIGLLNLVAFFVQLIYIDIYRCPAAAVFVIVIHLLAFGIELGLGFYFLGIPAFFGINGTVAFFIVRLPIGFFMPLTKGEDKSPSGSS